MTNNSSNKVTFYKMQGSGNDFILFDNTSLRLAREDMPFWASKLCPRGFAVGADGMIFLDKTAKEGLDYVWHFYNSDGSRAEMCGNGSRCASLLANIIGLAGKDQVFGTDAGPITARILDQGLVKVQLTPAINLRLNIPLTLEGGQEINVHHVNTGVPHAVVVCENVDQVDVAKVGRAIRFHKEFSPSGTNVNFIEKKGDDSIILRTYERGVEDETFACGTGAAASVVVGSALKILKAPVEVTTSGGEFLAIDISEDQVFLTGKATLVFKGEFSPETFGL
ncbi:diaminopimelate epimerase [Desulfonatronovibrio hydrogenovorans]|uniref:diaminopimelate epimerase n=1 Tax=Desulfonatronovibrio hydrogenovorans TaxID=53245 RepID=UPI00048BA820|nr:diaminopimelate epimerase [Desulfonatronovibrio hydrogenovorans]